MGGLTEVPSVQTLKKGREKVIDNGAFLISLDFELNWGVHDVYTKEQYGKNILGVRQAIPEMLALFQQYDIHATWATVGMLCFTEKKKLIEHFPALLPSYIDQNFSPYGKMENLSENEGKDPYHFGESLVHQILQVPYQEIGTHTFSHYYCLENGQDADQFRADLQAALNVPCLENLDIRSLVFPRNQTNSAYLNICKELGIQSYRGNEKNWVYGASGYKDRSKVKRLIRLMDCYVNITGHHTFNLGEESPGHPVNLQSSRFLRPYNPKLKTLEPMRLNRIKKGVEYAARRGEIYHLWWHPHNFGTHLEENISFLRKILDHVSKMRETYGMQSMNMGEVATNWELRKAERPHISFNSD
ncbi:polysaccharide deacetylase family protein [Sporosarcina luteola]|uniref:polysaccharide deacetylase family protein n=1 Tax=Sporosarcina luteola TaxID=582850 RepID=UPI00203A6E36|nr:polysaccharide deacetylase family protein [Sporosarcina luteola]MCM3711639.1 polysaccharide deacetylase family protein [Sporosarcina luteola]